jgi:hypothetical protein
VRESQRVTLTEVNQRTKISLQYLKSIEDDDFGRLPGRVHERLPARVRAIGSMRNRSAVRT